MYKRQSFNSISKFRTDSKIQYAKQNRKNPTHAEYLLKKRLRLKRSHPQYLRFKFQYIVLGYILDFYFAPCRLCVEVDGPYHLEADQKEKDIHRQHMLRKLAKIKTIRFTNYDVINNIETVVSNIYMYMKKHWKLAPEWIKNYTL